MNYIRAFVFSVIWLFAPMAYACSCICEFDKPMSELMKDEIVFWGVPIESRWEGKPSGRQYRNGAVETKIRVLNDFDTGLSRSITVYSYSPRNSCGQPIGLGAIGLFQVRMDQYGEFHQSACSCLPPYKSVKDYLLNKEDFFVPEPDSCDDETSPKSGCDVWDESNEWRALTGEIRHLYKTYKNDRQ